MTRRHWTEAQKAEVLAAYEANQRNRAKTAAETGVSESTLQRWIDDPERAAPSQVRSEKLADLDGLCEQVARGGLKYVLAWLEKFGDIPDGRMIRDVLVGVGIAIDKMRVLRDQPTAHLVVDDLRSAAVQAGVDATDVLAEVEAMLREAE